MFRGTRHTHRNVSPGVGLLGAMARAGQPWRFSVDSSAVDTPRERAWTLSENTVAAFRQLAEASCGILTGCRQQCEQARSNGRAGAAAALLMLLAMPPETVMPLPRLHAECALLLAREEHPAGAEASGRAHGGRAGAAPLAVAPLPAGGDGWEPVDSMYGDEAFRVGCVLFTQFYRGECCLCNWLVCAIVNCSFFFFFFPHKLFLAY